MRVFIRNVAGGDSSRLYCSKVYYVWRPSPAHPSLWRAATCNVRTLLPGPEGVRSWQVLLYLGITISNDLKWKKHVSNITSKANSTLGILRRNLRLSSHTVNTHAYQALVRPHLEYASAVWDPHTHFNTQTLEMVQRRAARYVCNGWHNTSSVTGMLSQLKWVLTPVHDVQNLLIRR